MIDAQTTPPGFTPEEIKGLWSAIPEEGREQLIKTYRTPGPKPLRNAIPKGRGRIKPEEYLARVRRSMHMGFTPMTRLVQPPCEYGRTVCVVGGGPSLRKSAYWLRKMVNQGAHVMACNKSHDWCLNNGIPVHYSVLIDPKEWVADYVDPTLAERKGFAPANFLIASQCHDKTLAKFRDVPTAYLWHAAAGLGEGDMLVSEFNKTGGWEWAMIPGPSVVGLRCVYILTGFRAANVVLFGIDGSAVPSKTQSIEGKTKLDLYAYEKPFVDETWHEFDIGTSTGHKRTFVANHHMARSVYEFEDMVLFFDKQIRAGKVPPFNLRVHGDPETSAIAFLAAAKFGIHANPNENARFAAMAA